MRTSWLLGPPSDPVLDGLSTAVYGLVLPETREMTRRLWAERPEVLYENAYEQSQDLAHVALFERWSNWVSPLVTGLPDYRHRYATNGSSEAIRESIWSLAKAAHDSGRRACLHVFTGEYEGYAAYARAAGIAVLTHDRATWSDIAFAPDAVHRWYVSQPSATDGNVWSGFLASLRAMAEGDKWFKNMFSLYLGASLIDETPSPVMLPAKYRHVQTEACEILSARHGIPLAPSDVLLLATTPPGDYPAAFRRGTGYRYCLTPTMDRLLRAHGEKVPADA